MYENELFLRSMLWMALNNHASACSAYLEHQDLATEMRCWMEVSIAWVAADLEEYASGLRRVSNDPPPAKALSAYTVRWGAEFPSRSSCRMFEGSRNTGPSVPATSEATPSSAM